MKKREEFYEIIFNDNRIIHCYHECKLNDNYLGVGCSQPKPIENSKPK